MSRIVSFWLPVVGFNLRLESHALLLNTGIMHASPLKRTQRLTLDCPATLFLETRPSPALWDRRSASDRYGEWVVENVLKRLAAVHGAVNSDLTSSPTCDAQCDTPGAMPRCACVIRTIWCIWVVPLAAQKCASSDALSCSLVNVIVLREICAPPRFVT